MSAKARWATLAVLLVGAVVAVSVSHRTRPDQVSGAAGDAVRPVVLEQDLPVLDPGPLPSVAGATGWINTDPLTSASLHGSVVLVDFWTFGCINCQHTLSHVKAWYARYAADGLVVLSVHTPEFSYEADPANVQDYVTREGITYPVALDPEMAVWHAWDNHAWPGFYLYDTDGRLRLQHLGEGRYDMTEDSIRALLGVDPASPRADV